MVNYCGNLSLTNRGLYFKTFYNSIFFHIATVNHLHPSLVYEGKSGAYQTYQSLLDLTPSLALKYLTKIEVTDSFKHSSLFDYGKIHGQCYMTIMQ